MAEAAVQDEVGRLIEHATELEAAGDVRGAIDRLSEANRRARDPRLEVELVRLRRAGASAVPVGGGASPEPIASAGGGGDIVELAPSEITVAALREGFAQSGCVLVRGLVPGDRAAMLAQGIDESIGAYDAAIAGATTVDPAWYSPGPMPDRVSPGLPDSVHREFLRGRGGMWTVDSPRMVFELFELVDDLGIGSLMTDFLGERPLLSALKGTMRRVEPDVEVVGRWHQDGAFLGERIGAFNMWVTFTACGRDAPGLDVVPKRFDRILTNEGARFDWSVADEVVAEAAGGTPIVRPEFGVGDALLFDHLLLHRTAASPGMTRRRYALESWFFAPSSYPAGQLPILY